MTKPTVKIRTIPNGQKNTVIGIKVGQFGYHTMAYLKTSDREGVEIRGDATVLATLFQTLANKIHTRPPRTNTNADSWDWLTPEIVIDYFRKSVALKHMLKDVVKALDHLTTTQTDAPPAITLDRLSEDLKRVKKKYTPSQLITNSQPKRGAQTQVAKVLNIPNAGQSNRRRILNVLKEIAA